MDIKCKIIGCNRRLGQESICIAFPERTGEVVTLAVQPDEMSQFIEGATYRLAFELVSAPVLETPNPESQPPTPIS